MSTTSQAIRVLLIDDDKEDYQLFRNLVSEIEGSKIILEWASSFDAGKAAISKKTHDVCFLDYRLGGKTGLDLLKEVIAEGCTMPLILLTGYGEHEVDLEAMKVGAADYLVKDQVTPLLLERSMRYSIHRAQSLQEILNREAQIIMQDRLASVGLLASSLAHEIGTPLGVIRGRAEYLSLQLKDNANIQKNADVIISEIDRISKLIRSLLNLARGDQTRVTGDILLNQVVSDVLELLGHELKRNKIEVQNQIPGDVPIKVSAEAEPLHQVLLNLLVNSLHAIDFAVKQNRPSGHFVRISAKNLGNQWALSVEDSGCGISETNMRNLFKPFFTTKDIGVGTGLGLATSYRIVESWGGSIQAESKQGVGSIFRILLPKPRQAPKGPVNE